MTYERRIFTLNGSDDAAGRGGIEQAFSGVLGVWSESPPLVVSAKSVRDLRHDEEYSPLPSSYSMTSCSWLRSRSMLSCVRLFIWRR